MSDRFGFDAPKSQPIEDSIVWAAGNGFRYIDFQADVPPNAIASLRIPTAARRYRDALRPRPRTVRELCERHGVALGIHPSSAINNAEPPRPRQPRRPRQAAAACSRGWRRSRRRHGAGRTA